MIIRNKILIYISIFLLYATYVVNRTFGRLSLEQIIFSIFLTDNTNANVEIVGIKIFNAFVFFLILHILVRFYRYLLSTHKTLVLELKIKNNIKKINVFPLNLSTKASNRLSIIIFIMTLLFLMFNFKVHDFIISHLTYSNIYEEYYADPNSVNIEFTEKRNLIYIILESMETTYSRYQENNRVINLIPNLTNIARENISFSSNDDFGGLTQNTLNSWTIASLVGQTSGVPLNIPIDRNSYSNSTTFLPNIVALGDILEKEGYNQTIMFGSDSTYGGRKKYFKTHGNYKIFDYFSAKENKKIEDDYYVFWGYEDQKLFEYAKEEILHLYNKNKPFNFSLLTVDTHFMDGYMDSNCEELFNSSYANAIYCSDKKVSEFLNWIKEQEFYNNTTIVIVGDHLTMNNEFVEEANIGADRKIYNTFINSNLNTNYTKNRVATVIDLFPTTLTSIGAKIEGERLALGTNLFSDIETLPELLTHEYFDRELFRKSKYYIKLFK